MRVTFLDFESTGVSVALGENQLDHGSWRPRPQKHEKAQDAFIVAVVTRFIDRHNKDKESSTGKERSLSHGIVWLSTAVINKDVQSPAYRILAECVRGPGILCVSPRWRK
jgi:hypothetical protein